MIRNIFSVLVILITMTTTSMAQKQETHDPFQNEWQQIDSLTNKGRPQSAAEIARHVLATAQRKGDNPNAIKAQLFLMSVEEHIQEHADVRHIQQIDSIILASDGVEKALWQSINAELYWQYYQRNRWMMLNRTPIAGEPPADMAT